MSAPLAHQEGRGTPFVQRLEACSWKFRDIAEMRKALSFFENYDFFRCFPYFSGGGYGETLQDAMTADQHTVLSLGSFRWLVNIRPGYHLLRSGMTCLLEPYFPSRFSRQFGYDQLYVGNINPQLKSEGGLIDGARGWFWAHAGCTGARFELPLRDRVPHHTFTYCKWYRSVSIAPEGFDIHASCLTERPRRSRGPSRMPQQGERRHAEEPETVQAKGAETSMPTRVEAGPSTGALREDWVPAPHSPYDPSFPWFSQGVTMGLSRIGERVEGVRDSIAEHMQLPSTFFDSLRPSKHPREEGATSADEEVAKKARHEEASPAAGSPVLPHGQTALVIVEPQEPPASVHLDTSATSEGATDEALEISSGDEGNASDHEADSPPREEGVGAGASSPPRVASPPTGDEHEQGTPTTPVGKGSSQEEASTEMNVVTGAEIQHQSPEDTPLSSSARIKKRLVESTVKDLQDLLRDSIQMVLEGSCSFDELKPMLEMYVGNLITLTGADATAPLQRRLAAAERDVQELIALRSRNLLAEASEHARSVVREQQEFLDKTLAEETALAEAVALVSAEGERLDQARQEVDTRLAEVTQSLLNAEQTIADLRAFIVTKTPVREATLKELNEIEMLQQLAVSELEEKCRALEETRTTLRNAVSITEDEIREKVLATLERDHQKALWDIESRLKRF